MREIPSYIRIARPVSEGPLGASALAVDLGGFFATAREVGFDPALLFLTLRALMLRHPLGVPVRDLQWTLGAERREVFRWLEFLEDAGLATWQARGNSVIVEVDATESERTLFGPEDEPGVVHRVPTRWFVRTLPLVGRKAFLAYLYLRSRERASGLTAPLTIGTVARASGQSARAATRALRRLRRAGLCADGGGHGRFVLTDPPPLSRLQRSYLRWLETGALPPTRSGRLRLALWLSLPVAVILTGLLLLLP